MCNILGFDSTVHKFFTGHCMEFYAKELSEATRTYGRGNVIGKGGFGTVYRGTLRYSTVAIKILSQVRSRA